MESAWTGGQWSLVRALAALLPAAWVLEALVRASTIGGGAAASLAGTACLLVAIGHRLRLAAIVLLAWLGLGLAPGGHVAHCYAAAWLLTLLAVGAEPPYGAWDAAGRDRPAGRWRMPPWLPVAGWSLFVFHHAARGLDALGEGHIVAGFVDLDFALFALAPSLRPLVWVTSLGAEVGPLLVSGVSGLDGAAWLVQLLSLQPCWFPPRESDEYEWVFYDGSCALCHSCVRFLLSEDLAPPRFRLAPLGGPTFTALLPTQERASLPDSILVACEDGRVLVKSAAVLFLLDGIGGLWRPLAAAARLIPLRWLDVGYDRVAARRYRWFGRKSDSCPVADAELRARFEA